MGASMPTCSTDDSDPAAGAEGEAAPQYESNAWSTDLSYCLGGEGCQQFFGPIFDEFELLDPQTHSSVASVVEVLNGGMTRIQDGYCPGVCIVFSTSKQKYYLLWRRDMVAYADEILAPIRALKQASGLEQWSKEQVCALTSPNCEVHLRGKVSMLDRNKFTSLEYAVDCLNAGSASGLAQELGICVLWDADAEGFFMLWRFDKSPDAQELLEKLPGQSPPGGRLESFGGGAQRKEFANVGGRGVNPGDDAYRQVDRPTFKQAPSTSAPSNGAAGRGSHASSGRPQIDEDDIRARFEQSLAQSRAPGRGNPHAYGRGD
eukprot:TRINITY_DN50036_c0_g1_i1.p1 TRINITY_DN50036_c0_g1~~TRINITY_DN50036_c0_g1_i1.p1  ORF type:complete len:318 (-),score=51.70 TRINITY_DN50036_c0_g1_i1:302-1255(-)